MPTSGRVPLLPDAPAEVELLVELLEALELEAGAMELCVAVLAMEIVIPLRLEGAEAGLCPQNAVGVGTAAECAREGTFAAEQVRVPRHPCRHPAEEGPH